MLTKEIKDNVIQQFSPSSNNPGSTEAQIALLSARINQISAHLKKFPKDFHSQRGLLILVGRRRVFLRYLKKTNAASHSKLESSLKTQGLI